MYSHRSADTQTKHLYRAMVSDRAVRFLVADAASWDNTVVARGIHVQRCSASLAPMIDGSIAVDRKDIGIGALSYYAPNLALKASSAEAFHVSPGRYTMGRGQENITFVSDDEDTVSLALSSLSRLLR